MSTSDVKPTRMELIETKRKIKLSKSGYKLLKMKRDGLIMEFFELLPKVKDLRSQLSELYSDAMEKLAIAVAADGKSPWQNPLAPKDSPLPARAKNVIFLFMYGGPSHMDTFEYKP